MERQLIWVTEDTNCMHHLQLARDGNGWFVDSLILGMAQGRALRCHYSVRYDRSWHPRQVAIEISDRPPLRLRSDGQGNWDTGLAEPLVAFTNCLDIVLNDSPFSHTPVLHRLALRAGEKVEISVLEINLIDLTLHRGLRHYECFIPATQLVDQEDAIEIGSQRNGEYKSVLLQGESHKSLVLHVDFEGFLLDQPNHFNRLYPSARFPAVDTASPAPLIIPDPGHVEEQMLERERK